MYSASTPPSKAFCVLVAILSQTPGIAAPERCAERIGAASASIFAFVNVIESVNTIEKLTVNTSCSPLRILLFIVSCIDENADNMLDLSLNHNLGCRCLKVYKYVFHLILEQNRFSECQSVYKIGWV